MSQTEVQLIKSSSVVDGDIVGMASSKLSGALPAISGASLTNLPSTGKARNLIINGAMNIAQRGTSSTSTGIYTVDRFVGSWSGQDESPTQSQEDVASGTTPYTEGFRKSFRITNGNQTSGAGASDIVYYEYQIEAQDIATSGWNYASSSSYLTLSFWVKSSVSQDFKGYLRTVDGTSQSYPYSTGTLSADTWTKITKTIPGNSNLQFDNDTGPGLQLYLWPYIGTTYTDSGVTENAWAAYASGTRTPVSATTWWTTDNATIEITGVQLEVGSSATDFEHRSYQDEFQRCERYYEQHEPSNFVMGRYSAGTGNGINNFKFRTMKRAVPTFTTSGTFASNSGYAGTPTASYLAPDGCMLLSAVSISANQIVWLSSSNATYGTRAKIIFSSEL